MEKFRPYRFPTNYPAKIHTSEGVKDGVFTNVTRTGARLENVGGLKVGEVVRFFLLSHQLAASVKWVDGEDAGVEFQPQLSTMQFNIMFRL